LGASANASFEMLQTTWCEIECVDGVAATLHILRDLQGADLNEISTALSMLPQSVATLRIQLRHSLRDVQQAAALIQVLRRWRESLGQATRVIMTPSALFTGREGARYPAEQGRLRVVALRQV
jgi:hypothetical protein